MSGRGRVFGAAFPGQRGQRPGSVRFRRLGRATYAAPVPYQMGTGRIIPGRTRRTGYWGRGFTGRRAAAGDAGPELKFHDVDVDQAAADISAGVILNTSSINLIAQGTQENQRIGRKCVVRSINWRGKLQLIANAGSVLASPESVRLMVVLDKQCNGAAPTVTGVLESADHQSFNNLANKSRFRTLSDKTYDMNAIAGAGNGTADDTAAYDCSFSFFKAVNLPLEFDSTAGAITEIRSNNLFILMIGSTAFSSVELESKMRLRFSDG